jgi:hypothetical protein
MTSFSVHCSPGFNGGMEQFFLMEVRESQSQVLRYNVSSAVPRFSVTGLEAGSHYQACVYSFNHKGRSEPVVIQASTLRLPEKQLTSEKGGLPARVHSLHLSFLSFLSIFAYVFIF